MSETAKAKRIMPGRSQALRRPKAFRLLPRAMLLGLLIAAPARAQDWTGYRQTSLDEIDARVDKVARAEHTGVSLVPFENVHFIARYDAVPMPCPVGLLETVFVMRGKTEVLKRISVHTCVGLASAKGRGTQAFVQDVLAPGLRDDAKLGGPIEIWAVLVGYVIKAQKGGSRPMLIVNRFEPK